MKKIIKWGLIVFVGFIVLVAIVGGGSDTENDGAGQPSNTETTETTDTNKIAKEQKIKPNFDTSLPYFSDGTHRVGEDIEPGTYRTRVGSSNCYFARVSGFSGELDEILSNENTSAPTVVTIRETDAGFQSRSCGTWTQDLSQVTESMTGFGDGMFIVGTDIQPGTYRNTGQSGCYYSRLSGFTGDLSTIIANNNVDEQTIVTISANDKGFKSVRCGTWELVE